MYVENKYEHESTKIKSILIGIREDSDRLEEKAINCGIIWELFLVISNKLQTKQEGYLITTLLDRECKSIRKAIRNHKKLTRERYDDLVEKIRFLFNKLNDKNKKKVLSEKTKKKVIKQASLGKCPDTKRYMAIYENILKFETYSVIKSSSGKRIPPFTEKMKNNKLSASMPNLPGKRNKLEKAKEKLCTLHPFWSSEEEHEWVSEKGTHTHYIVESSSRSREQHSNGSEVYKAENSTEKEEKIPIGDLIPFGFE